MSQVACGFLDNKKFLLLADPLHSSLEITSHPISKTFCPSRVFKKGRKSREFNMFFLKKKEKRKKIDLLKGVENRVS